MAEQNAAAAVPRPSSDHPAVAPSERVGWYSWYTLVILALCYFFNYIDRNILSILAEEVKRDLGLKDAQIGFLYGTAFATFYAVFGIPFGRLADAWPRKNLVAVGLFVWSLMTALTGTARSLATLTTYRVGVGIGEATLSPSAYSLLADLFPARLRATALALYSTGITLGAAAGLFLGGYLIDAWSKLFPDGSAPFGLRAWQGTFVAVGLPGLALAVWVWTLRDPPRGGRENLGTTPARPAALLVEFATVVPGFTLVALWRAGAGPRGLALNLAGAGLLALLAWLLTLGIGAGAQWAALAVGLYAAFSWGQCLRLRDRDAFDGILRNRAFMYASVGFASISVVTNGFVFWTAPYLLRAHGATSTRVGLLMGLGMVGGGWLGTMAGGLISDRLKKRRPEARVDMGIAAVLLGAPCYYAMVRAGSLEAAGFYFFLLIVVCTLWLGPGAASANELAPVRARSTASAVYLLLNAFIGFALGPFAVGKLSDAFAAAGHAPARALGNAMLASISFWLVSLCFLWRGGRHAGPTEAALARLQGPAAQVQEGG